LETALTFCIQLFTFGFAVPRVTPEPATVLAGLDVPVDTGAVPGRRTAGALRIPDVSAGRRGTIVVARLALGDFGVTDMSRGVVCDGSPLDTEVLVGVPALAVDADD